MTKNEEFNRELRELLYLIYEQPMALQATEARTRAKAIAYAASRGLITSLNLGTLDATNEWRLTQQAYHFFVQSACQAPPTRRSHVGSALEPWQAVRAGVS